MSFRTAYGNKYSENGWRMCNSDECDSGVIPGTGIRLPLRAGAPTLILKAFASRFNKEVENLGSPGGDEGGWTLVNDVGNSNHLAGTAMDLNWNQHAFRVSFSGFNNAEIQNTRRLLNDFRGCVWWGQDWISPKDAMHFQLNYPEGDARINALATDLRNGLWGIWAPGQAPMPGPAAPLGGDTSGMLMLGSTGQRVKVLQTGFNKVFPSYAGLPLVVDGDFGPFTDHAVKEFQARVGLIADGIVGPNTLAQLAKYGIKP